MKKLGIICLIVIGAASTWAQGWRNNFISTDSIDQKNIYEIKGAMDDYYREGPKGKGSGYKQYKRWYIENESKFYPSGRLFNYAKINDSESKRINKNIVEPSNRWTHGKWQSMGPYDWSQAYSKSGGLGRVNCVGFHPVNNNIIYIGTPAGGLWKTINGGASWFCLTEGLPSIGVSSILITPNNPNVMYILTGDGDAGETPSIGVLKSLDAGASWETTDLVWGDSLFVRGYKMSMNPSDANEIVVASSEGIWRTTDGGLSFDQKKNGYFTDIEYHPADHDIIYGARLSGLYRSTDGGDNFFKLSDPDIDTLVHNVHYNRITIAVTEDDPDYFYALYGGGPTGFRGLFKSINSGATFGLVADSPNILSRHPEGIDSSHQASFDLAFDIDPSNGNNLLVGGINIWKSTNQGSNWAIKSYWVDVNNPIGFVHADIHNINYRGSDIFACTDGGIFKSVNNGEDWVDLTNNLPITMIYDFDVNNDILVCGSQDNGSMKWSINDPDLIAEGIYGGDGFESMIDLSSPNVVYGGSQGNRARSTNGGASWCDITPPVSGCNFDDGDDGGQWDASWVMHPTDFDTLYAATTNLYRSYDRGNSWENVNVPLPSEGDTFLIRAMAQSTLSTNNMFVSDRFKLWWTSNLHSANASNVSWQEISGGLPTDIAQIGSLATEPGWNSHLWVTFLGYSPGEKVYYTSNWGLTWTNISSNLPNVPIRCIFHEPGSNDGIYVGTEIGVFYKNGTMTEWEYFSNGLPNVPVTDINMEDGYLYISTWGRGVWRTIPYTSCPDETMLTIANDPSNPYHTGTQVYHANTGIVSTRLITGSLGTNVEYNAGNYIRLDPGFHSKSKSILSARIDGCPD